MNYRIASLIISLLLVLASCQKEVPLAPIKTVTVSDFPNALGSTWVYHVIDSLQPIDPNKPEIKIDTVTTTIDRHTTIQELGLEATVWTYQLRNRAFPIKLVEINGNTVYLYWNYGVDSTGQFTFFGKIGLVFPFDYRDTWQTGGFVSGDKTTVIDTIALRLPTALYPKVYVLKNERRTSIESDKRIMTLWFVPKLGIVKIHSHEEHAQSVGDTTWIMVDHNNPNF